MFFSALWIPLPFILLIPLVGYLIYREWFLYTPKSVNGKVIVLTGASSGIGAELALLFSKKNTKLVLAARRVDKLEELKTKCEANGSQVLCVKTDVSIESDCKNLIETAVSHFGGLDILICNAGLGQSFFLEATNGDSANFHTYMDINYWGCIWPTFYSLAHLRKSKGHIVVVSSLGGLVPFPRQTLYNSSKFALQGFYETLRTELGGSGVDITIANPGFIKTEMTTGGAIGKDGKPLGDIVSKKMIDQMMTVDECCKALFAAILARKRNVVVPGWYKLFPYVKLMFPELLDYYFIKNFAAVKGRAKKEQ